METCCLVLTTSSCTRRRLLLLLLLLLFLFPDGTYSCWSLGGLDGSPTETDEAYIQHGVLSRRHGPNGSIENNA